MAFSPLFIRFFEELSQNNHKEWFDAIRKIYETEVKAPFKPQFFNFQATFQQLTCEKLLPSILSPLRKVCFVMFNIKVIFNAHKFSWLRPPVREPGDIVLFGVDSKINLDF